MNSTKIHVVEARTNRVTLDQMCLMAKLIKLNPTNSISHLVETAIDEGGPFKHERASVQGILWTTDIVERLKKFVSGQEHPAIPEDWRSQIMLNYNS